MSRDSDPLLRALAQEDPSCPDGRVLVALGQLIRTHGSLPNATQPDLADDVLARLGDDSRSDNALIDAAVDGEGEGSALLTRLGDLLRVCAPQPVDLRERVLTRIRASSRLLIFAKNADSALVRTKRWRIWGAVLAFHAAALLALAILEIGSMSHAIHNGDSAPDPYPATHPTGTDARLVGSRGGSPTPAPVEAQQSSSLPHSWSDTRLPHTWSEIHTLGSDLFLLRRFPELRQQARSYYGMTDSAAAVAAGLSWLNAQQDPVTGYFGTPTGNEERDLATQSLAILAELGEGLGNRAHSGAARRGLGWLCGHLVAGADGDTPPLAAAGQISAGLACLALVEGGMLLGDATLQAQAESCLVALDDGQPMQPGAAGLGGFVLLAIETAQQGGMRVPSHLLQQSRHNIGRSLPSQDDDVGRLGMAAFARFILGHRDNSSTVHEIERLGQLLPRSDANGRVDPLSWFFATLAMREAGGEHWQKWSAALQQSLVPLLVPAQDGTAHVDRAHIRFGASANDIFATSVTLLDLQAPYRYLPIAATP